MSSSNQVVSPEPSSSRKGKQKAPAQNTQDVVGEGEISAEQTEDHRAPSESRNLSSSVPSFKPFFTLIEDANSSDHHNPTVHYIFSDDDTDLVTEAALRALEPEGAASLPPGTYDDDGDDEYAHRREPKHSALPPPTPGVQEHYIVLDMQPTPVAAPTASSKTQSETAAQASAQVPATDTEATTTTTTTNNNPTATSGPTTPQTYTVTSVHSLTPTWQVLDTELSPAPTFETTPNQDTDATDPSQGGLMLKIKGTSGYKPGPTRGRNNDQTRDQSLEEMMEQFEKRMDELRRVIEAGDLGSTAADDKQEMSEGGRGEVPEGVKNDGEEKSKGKGKGKAVEDGDEEK